MASKAPDFFGTHTGWKGLLANSAGSLFSPMLTPWPEREEMAAACGHKHTPPAKGCSCGIYACKTFADLKANGYNVGYTANKMLWVVAKLDMWGRYAEGNIGFRMQFAYPKKVFVPASDLKLGSLIRERYGVKIGIIDRYTGKGAAS